MVHGELEVKEEFRQKVVQELDLDARVPSRGEKVDLVHLNR